MNSLSLRLARRAAAHDPLERLPAPALGVLAAVGTMVALAARVGHPLTRPDARGCRYRACAASSRRRPNRSSSSRAALLGARAVVVHARLAAVLGHQPDDQVSMVRAAGGLAVADRHPPALRPRVCAGETHLRDELARTISAHRSSESSGSSGCRLSEQCHTCASRAPTTRPSPSRSAIVTRVPNGSRGSSRNRASSPASRPPNQTRSPAIRSVSGDPPPGAGPRAPRACPCPTR